MLTFKKYLFLIGFILTIAGCAKIVTPTGGQKDLDPPVIMSSKPENYSTNFKRKDISISFNEYIQLKDLNKNLIISPPLKEKPIIRVKGKTLSIKIESELKDSTTYNIYFGEALQDYNEGNPYKNFQYIFSTGNYIDSLGIEGALLNAFDLTPIEDAFVMLYSDLSDSVPYTQIPEYVSKTNKKGVFKINNIRHGRFKLFALKDGNNNYKFDNNTEEIAFTDSVISFKLESFTQIDTVFKKREIISNKELDKREELSNEDVFLIDTIIKTKVLGYKTNNYVLMMFSGDFEQQYLKNNKRDSKQKLEFVFNRAIKDSVILKILDNPKTKIITELKENADTIIYWLTDTTLIAKEDILCTISYQKLDSSDRFYWQEDTLHMKYI